jgi:hypothetical protein
MELTKAYIDSILMRKESKILVCTTPVSVPLCVFVHTFLVVIHEGEVHRYEVFRFWGERQPQRGVVYKDLFKPWEGNSVFVSILQRLCHGCRFKVCILAEFSEGAECILREYSNYPFSHHYKYWGPNSNTFTAWLLKKAGIAYSLPRRAIGRNFL